MVLCVRAASPISVYLYPAHRICAPPAHACTAPHSQLPTALRPRHLLREVLPRRAHSGRAAAAHNRAAGSTRPRHSQPAHTNRPRTELGGLAPQGRIRRDGSGQLNTSLQRQIKRCSARVWRVLPAQAARPTCCFTGASTVFLMHLCSLCWGPWARTRFELVLLLLRRGRLDTLGAGIGITMVMRTKHAPCRGR